LLDCLLFQARASPHEPASNYPAFPFAAPLPVVPQEVMENSRGPSAAKN
jgi:hypothetical protein